MKSKLMTVLCFLLLLLVIPAGVSAQENEAVELSSLGLVKKIEGFQYCNWLFDGNVQGGQMLPPNSSVYLESEEGMGSCYLIHKQTPVAEYTLVNEETGESKVCGTQGFLHEYVDLTELFGGPVRKLTLKFGEKPSVITEIRVFAPGEPPKDVQRWKMAPEEGVDLLIFPTHGDDVQLFFAGMLPYYAGELGYEVQVAYATDHANYGPDRPHEMLNGLWLSGVTNYPVFGQYPDYMSDTPEVAMQGLVRVGYTEEDFLGYVVEQIRRFKPKVVVGHDLNGEYGHGMHKLYAKMVQQAVNVSNDPVISPESAEKYGTWDVPKAYLHLYPENQITVNWDIPLEHFDGMTAYEVTKKLGFPAHQSQYSGFAWYMGPYERAADIPEMSPCSFGLIRTTVGPDVEKNDLFENVTSRAEDKLLEQQKQEEQAKQETTEPEQSETQPGETETAAPQVISQEEQLNQSFRNMIITLSSIFGVLVLVSLIIFFSKRKK